MNQPTPSRSPMPPVDDRIAADLRARLQAAQWSSDTRLCHELRSWQRALDVSPHEAAARLGVPHVTHDTFLRLRSFQRVHGHGAHWPELLGLHIEHEVKRQVVASPPATVPVAADSDIRAVADAVARETGTPGGRRRPSMRTAATAALIMAAAADQSQSNKHNVTGLRGMPALAEKLARIDLPPGASDEETARAISKWRYRLQSYANLLVVKSRPPLTVVPTETTDAAPRHRTRKPVAVLTGIVAPAAGTAKIIGRPELRTDGKLNVTVAATATIEIGPNHPLWAEAITAVNAPK